MQLARMLPHLFVALCEPACIVRVKTIELSQRVSCDGVVLQVKGGQGRALTEDASRYRL